MQCLLSIIGKNWLENINIFFTQALYFGKKLLNFSDNYKVFNGTINFILTFRNHLFNQCKIIGEF